MISCLTPDIIARIGDFCSVDERKKCREAALLFSPISNNYAHGGWNFNGPINDLNHKFNALLKVKPLLKTMEINILTNAALLDADDLVNIIKCFKDRSIEVTIDIFRNSNLLFLCINAGIYVNYCDFRNGTLEEFKKLASLPITINHLVINTLSIYRGVDTKNIERAEHLTVIDENDTGFSPTTRSMVTAATSLLANGMYLDETYINILKDASRLKILKFANMNFAITMATDRWQIFINMLQNNKTLNTIIFLWESLVNPHIIPFILLLLDHVPDLQIRVSGESSCIITDKQLVCVYLIKHKLQNFKNVSFPRHNKQNDSGMESMLESATYSQLLDKLALIAPGLYRLWQLE